MTEFDHLRKYISETGAKQKQAEAREHAYRPLLENLLQSLLPKYSVINDPAKVGHNAPDFLIKQAEVPCGYIEAKDITVDLSDKAVQKQAERYLEAFDSLILTNYREFRFYSYDEEYAKLTLDENTSEADLKRFTDLVTQFVQIAPTKIKSAKQLAEIMAHKSRIMRDVVVGLLKEQDQTGDIQGQYQAFKQVLIRDLTIEQFADMYTQTLTYGLFVARYFDDSLKNFSRHEAQDLLPPANPLLRKFFGHIAGSSFEPRLAWIIDDLIQAYRAADVSVIMHKEFEQKSKDPVLHFYETYLQEYDPKLRKSRGVYYTPEPVVSFIVRSVDEILKRDFGIKDGLADTSTIPWKFKTQNANKRGKAVKEVTKEVHRVQILDPAAGTGTFLVEVIKEIRKRFKNQEGQWPSYVKEHLLPRLHGFELMMASYTMAHLKLGITLGETGYKDTDKRLGVYLTNSLQEGVREVPNLLMGQWLTEESWTASRVKHELPIMVVLGNPPYSGVSSNMTEYAGQLVEKYKVEPGGKEKLQERKNWLNDDYVKFIALAEHMIQKTGFGIMAMITNHSYLDNPTSRGMRWHLTQTFDQIYIVDLHGNSKRKETAPNGDKDENVFDIQQGVAIILALKRSNQAGQKPTLKIYHTDLFGSRESKFASLEKTPIYKEVPIDKKMYLFTPQKTAGLGKYEKGVKLSDLFVEQNTGVMTSRDELVIDESASTLSLRMNKVFGGEYDSAFSSKYNVVNSGGYDLENRLKKYKFNASNIYPYEFRPFDRRFIYYEKGFTSRSAYVVMQHLLRNNLAFVVNKHCVSDFRHIFVTQHLTDLHIFETAHASAYVFPLYVFGSNNERKPNFNQKVLDELTKGLTKPYPPELIFDYIYAVLSSPDYRRKFREFLKADFPRIPIPKDDESFKNLVAFGKELRELHLMSSPKVNEFITTYPVAGSNVVEKPTLKEGKVWINKEQYFGGVPQTAWEFYIGGYQPAQKWLKDRKGRELSSDDIAHYQRIVKVLVETNAVMKQIDEICI